MRPLFTVIAISVFLAGVARGQGRDDHPGLRAGVDGRTAERLSRLALQELRKLQEESRADRMASHKRLETAFGVEGKRLVTALGKLPETGEFRRDLAKIPMPKVRSRKADREHFAAARKIAGRYQKAFRDTYARSGLDSRLVGAELSKLFNPRSRMVLTPGDLLVFAERFDGMANPAVIHEFELTAPFDDALVIGAGGAELPPTLFPQSSADKLTGELNLHMVTYGTDSDYTLGAWSMLGSYVTVPPGYDKINMTATFEVESFEVEVISAQVDHMLTRAACFLRVQISSNSGSFWGKKFVIGGVNLIGMGSGIDSGGGFEITLSLDEITMPQTAQISVPRFVRAGVFSESEYWEDTQTRAEASVKLKSISVKISQ